MIQSVLHQPTKHIIPDTLNVRGVHITTLKRQSMTVLVMVFNRAVTPFLSALCTYKAYYCMEIKIG